MFLQHNYNPLKVFSVDQNPNSQFQYAAIRGQADGILRVDEYRPQIFCNPCTTFINITDGIEVMIDQKYKPAKPTQFKGHPLVTSNLAIEMNQHIQVEYVALQKRFQQISFNNVQDHQAFERDLLRFKPEQCHSFAIHCNLLNHDSPQTKVPKSWVPPKQLKAFPFTPHTNIARTWICCAKEAQQRRVRAWQRLCVPTVLKQAC